MKEFTQSWQTNRTKRMARYTPMLAAIVVFGGLGTALLLTSHAATPVANVESENGTVSSAASTVSDSTASGSRAVKFGVASSGRTCPAYPAFPDANCTGVPSGYALTTVNGDFTTSSNGQAIDGKLITGDLVVNNSNVTVTNSSIKGRVVLHTDSGLVLQDVDLGADSCPASGGDYELIDGGNFKFVRVHAHNMNADLIRVEEGSNDTIQDSLLDDTCFYAGDHLDVVQYYDPGGVGHVNIIHSSLDARAVNTSATGNSAIFWADTPGAGSTLNVTQSKLAGGDYTTAFYDANAGSGVIIDVENNVYVKNSYQYGACSSSNSIAFNGTEGLKFIGNKYDDGSSLASC